MTGIALLRLCALLLGPLVACASTAQDPTSPEAPRATFWFATYPDSLTQFDPATDQVLRKVKLRGGMFWSVELAHDQKRMFVVTDRQSKVEIVDLQRGEVVDEHVFAEDGYVIRVRSLMEIPGGAKWYVRTDRIKKEIDRFSFEPSEWLLYDTATKKVEKKSKQLPKAIRNGARISPDGTKWHVGTEDGDLSIVDPETNKEVARIDLHTPRFAGAGPLRLSGEDLLRGRDPNRYRALFTSTDPVQKNRTTWGVAELDLVTNQIAEVVEWGNEQGGWGMEISAGGTRGATMSGGFGERSDRGSRLQIFDLTNGKRLAEGYEQFRPRRRLVAISPDGNKLYVGVAGSDFEVFDAQCRRLKSVELDGEISGQIHVVDG